MVGAVVNAVQHAVGGLLSA